VRTICLFSIVIATVGCAACAAPPTTANTGEGAVREAAVPRTADGKPDLTGVWQGGNGRRGTWEEANSGLGVGGTGADPSAPANPASQQVIADPAPYQPAAARRVLEAYNRRGIDDPVGYCLPPGIPRSAIVGLFPLQIVQTPTQVVILYEYMSAYRIVPIDAPHPEDVVPTYMGDSVGHWEGDTLVVDVVGFNDRTWLTGTGTFHSEALRVTERYTRVDKDQIDYVVTMEDPNVLTRPWTIRTTLMLREGTRLREYVCAENNSAPERYEKLLAEGVNFRRQ
jgi:hypothetical protein